MSFCYFIFNFVFTVKFLVVQFTWYFTLPVQPFTRVSLAILSRVFMTLWLSHINWLTKIIKNVRIMLQRIPFFVFIQHHHMSRILWCFCLQSITTCTDVIDYNSNLLSVKLIDEWTITNLEDVNDIHTIEDNFLPYITRTNIITAYNCLFNPQDNS